MPPILEGWMTTPLAGMRRRGRRVFPRTGRKRTLTR